MVAFLKPGARCVVHPKAYPCERWPGVVVSGRGKRRRVRYDCHGAQFTESFSLLEIRGEYDADGNAIMA